MQRRAFLAGFLAGSLAACAQPAPRVAPEEVVQRLYDPYFGRAEAERLENAAPWTDDLKDMIARASRQARASNVAWITFNPFFGSDDVSLGELAVSAQAPPADERVTVIVRFTNAGRSEHVFFDLVAIEGEWRVQDLRGDSWSLREMATAAPKTAS
jgi:hypothetical protein